MGGQAWHVPTAQGVEDLAGWGRERLGRVVPRWLVEWSPHPELLVLPSPVTPG